MLRKITAVFLLFSYAALAANITAFAAPDSSFDALAEFINENDNFMIAVYTFDNYDIAKLLQNKNFTLIVDDAPAGGLGEAEKFILCALNKGNVYLYQSKYHMHAKYAITSDKVLVTTENFGYSGFPQGYGNRGYGAVIEDENTAKDFISVFSEDLQKSLPFRCDKVYTISEKEKKNYQKKFDVEEFSGSAKAIFAPDAVDDVISFVNSSKQRLYIAQLYVHKEWGTKKEPKPNPLLEAAISRARDDVEVKILLDSSWFNVDEEGKNNEDTINYVNEIAKNENLSMQAKLIDLDMLNLVGLHGKLVIADNAALISSINWGENSVMRNREAGIIIEGGAADYFSQIFLNDWKAGAAGRAAGTAQLIVFILAVAVILVIISVIHERTRK